MGKGEYLSTSRRPNEALGAADAGLAINPNYAPLLAARAIAENSLGRFEQAKSDVQQAMRLSPRDPSIWAVPCDFGRCGDSASVISTPRSTNITRQSTQAITVYSAYSNLAAAYALEGKMDEAKTALAEARRLNPKLTIKWMIEHTPNLPAVFDGLRKAGLPEE